MNGIRINKLICLLKKNNINRCYIVLMSIRFVNIRIPVFLL